MREGYFFKVIDLLKSLLKLSLWDTIIMFLLFILNRWLLQVKHQTGMFVEIIHNTADFMILAVHLLAALLLLLVLIVMFISGPEIINRLRYDSVSHLQESVRLTLTLRNYLKMSGNGDLIDRYNHFTKRAYVNVQGKNLTLVINLPNDHETQRLIFNSTEDLVSQLVSMTQSYTLSNLKRKGNSLVIEGTEVPVR
ncbi:hypothetical protein LQZ24_02105 [Fructobacillus sp. M1-13]|uniref:Uncharacterized protein n=1 Tax=Fructobacillus papyriferae TaxID=2713171 RepID=A0ABS5QPU1_9LACO|nr:hypothetical protein [Fructobacillus papyriferae]MBS9334832.1 hypothetical protein [Fructobacillus papyriferae]MCD2158822.1 hypothetical protein [Fructobacillus papyriferae]